MSELLHWRNADWEIKHNKVLSDYIETYRAWYKILGTWEKAAEQVITLIRKNHVELFSNRTDDGLTQRIRKLERVMAGVEESDKHYDEPFYGTLLRGEWFA
ncbi:hypothetical protein MTP04_24290 [Lysinibacillus sp. PLM2]|nr:hypothetical protein MTP04_24290 [Lysinibacillus sp. PLM2]